MTRLLLLSLMLIGCTGASARDLILAKPANAYPASVRLALLQGCTDGASATGATADRCSCRIEAVQRLMTYAEFEAFAPKLADGTAADDPRWKQALQACP